MRKSGLVDTDFPDDNQTAGRQPGRRPAATGDSEGRHASVARKGAGPWFSEKSEILTKGYAANDT
jgi:hypothetical protein